MVDHYTLATVAQLTTQNLITTTEHTGATNHYLQPVIIDMVSYMVVTALALVATVYCPRQETKAVVSKL